MRHQMPKEGAGIPATKYLTSFEEVLAVNFHVVGPTGYWCSKRKAAHNNGTCLTLVHYDRHLYPAGRVLGLPHRWNLLGLVSVLYPGQVAN